MVRALAACTLVLLVAEVAEADDAPNPDVPPPFALETPAAPNMLPPWGPEDPDGRAAEALYGGLGTAVASVAAIGGSIVMVVGTAMTIAGAALVADAEDDLAGPIALTVAGGSVFALGSVGIVLGLVHLYGHDEPSLGLPLGPSGRHTAGALLEAAEGDALAFRTAGAAALMRAAALGPDRAEVGVCRARERRGFGAGEARRRRRISAARRDRDRARSRPQCPCTGSG